LLRWILDMLFFRQQFYRRSLDLKSERLTRSCEEAKGTTLKKSCPNIITSLPKTTNAAIPFCKLAGRICDIEAETASLSGYI
jgi:hypothetical protein